MHEEDAHTLQGDQLLVTGLQQGVVGHEGDAEPIAVARYRPQGAREVHASQIAEAVTCE